MIKINNKEDCCGCKSCGDVCPKNCISYEADIEGFWYPVVNQVECVDCHLCENVCPIKKSNVLKQINNSVEPECYAAENKNIEVIFDSTSGGLFSAFASYFYHEKGYVGGAVFNEDMSVSQFISSEKSDLLKLRSSKYLQSDCSGFYKSVLENLKTGKLVLVCGSPCQMAALRTFLNKDYDNLLILDYICHGINSPKVWQKYMDSFVERYGSKVVYAKAKSKEYGWKKLTQKIILENGTVLYEPEDVSMFTKGYLCTGVYCRPSCYNCKFKGVPRVSDITLGDFWGIESIDNRYNKDIGTSVVMINSEKGKKFFELIKSKINFTKLPLSVVIQGNPSLIKSLEPSKIDRKQFFEDLEKYSFTEIAKKYINDKSSFKGRIYSWGIKKLRFIYKILSETRCNPKALYQTIRYSGIKNLYHCKGIIFTPNCCVNIDKKAKINIDGVCTVGSRFNFEKSKLETRFLLEKNSTFNFTGNCFFGYGSDIEVFENAILSIKGGKFLPHTGSNIGLTIICMEKIEIGHDVQIGRNVTIRDNNGGHFMNLQGYKTSKPVIIKDKVWLCEQVLILQGVHINEGAIVGARSTVMFDVPRNVLVSGTPAQVVYKDVLWKY